MGCNFCPPTCTRMYSRILINGYYCERGKGSDMIGASEVKPFNSELKLLFEVAGIKNTQVFVK